MELNRELVFCSPEESKSIQQVQQYATQIVNFIQPYKWLIDSYLSDFFVLKHWEKFSPSWWRLLSQVQPRELAALLSDDHWDCSQVWPLSLLAFRATVNYLSLLRSPVTVEQKLIGKLLSHQQSHGTNRNQPVNSKNDNRCQEESHLSDLQCKSSLSSNGQDMLLEHCYRRHVKPKKQHEIRNLAQTVDSLGEVCCCRHVVDVGAGQGHLSRLLSFGYGLQVTTIEATDMHAPKAHRFDSEVQKDIEQGKFHKRKKKTQNSKNMNQPQNVCATKDGSSNPAACLPKHVCATKDGSSNQAVGLPKHVVAWIDPDVSVADFLSKIKLCHGQQEGDSLLSDPQIELELEVKSQGKSSSSVESCSFPNDVVVEPTLSNLTSPTSPENDLLPHHLGSGTVSTNLSSSSEATSDVPSELTETSHIITMENYITSDDDDVKPLNCRLQTQRLNPFSEANHDCNSEINCSSNKSSRLYSSAAGAHHQVDELPADDVVHAPDGVSAPSFLRTGLHACGDHHQVDESPADDVVHARDGVSAPSFLRTGLHACGDHHQVDESPADDVVRAPEGVSASSFLLTGLHACGDHHQVDELPADDVVRTPDGVSASSFLLTGLHACGDHHQVDESPADDVVRARDGVSASPFLLTGLHACGDHHQVDELPADDVVRAPDGVSASSFLLTGLHACGDLTPTMLRVFIKCPQAVGLASVACCYMKISTAGSDDPSGSEVGYPMSQFVQQLPGHQLSYEAREMACHSSDVYQQRLLDGPTHLKSHCTRAVLQEIIHDKDPSNQHPCIKLRVKRAHDLPFHEYAELALKKLGLDPSLTEMQLKRANDSLERWLEVVAFYTLRLSLAPVVETLILMDRLLCLTEQGVSSCLVPIFDPGLSPRNFVLLARKHCDPSNYSQQ